MMGFPLKPDLKKRFCDTGYYEFDNYSVAIDQLCNCYLGTMSNSSQIISGNRVVYTLIWNEDTENEIRGVLFELFGGKWGFIPNKSVLNLWQADEINSCKDRVFFVTDQASAKCIESIGYRATFCSAGLEFPEIVDFSPLSGKDVCIWLSGTNWKQSYTDVIRALQKLPNRPLIRLLITSNDEVSESVYTLIGDIFTPEQAAAMRQKIENMCQNIEPQPAPPIAPAVQYAWSPFPIDCLPSPLKDYVNTLSLNLQVDPAMLTLPLLVAAGAAVGNSCCLKLKDGWIEFPVLWGVLIADSGMKKTPVLKKIVHPFVDRNNKAIKEFTQANDEYQRLCKQCDRSSKNSGGNRPIAPKMSGRCLASVLSRKFRTFCLQAVGEDFFSVA